jgi:lipopolysaccharide export LptBFGC system permease protein LptF
MTWPTSSVVSHAVARAVTPLKDKVRETQEVLNHQYETLHGRVEDLNMKHENLERNMTRRLSQTESNLQEFQEETKAYNEQMRNDFTAEAARRAQSVPPRLHETRMNNPANLSQDELLERSIMLYGWARFYSLSSQRLHEILMILLAIVMFAVYGRSRRGLPLECNRYDIVIVLMSFVLVTNKGRSQALWDISNNIIIIADMICLISRMSIPVHIIVKHGN